MSATSIGALIGGAIDAADGGDDSAADGALIGAIVRDGKALFPRSDEVLQAGDRVIVFTERSRVPDVERVL